ncbi:hypothetical protein CLV46_0248 [Diaminobutyricimonas aerilata]|uniref:Uncharacterized protein n=1 Tax=Diaminobutyricimonas aerilata TaxID=1162967 RepID=A0A2M9CFN2_9MICO|nr:hypothetical protein [Diaminobutyricimonas aerilata]PJJ70723.1 hypothetical protein CLV46_0248 [Diaminobutyricimonas aerilata]
MAVAGFLLLVTAGCAPLGGSGFRVLDRAATDDDALPAVFLEQEGTYLKAGTARFAGEHDGNRIWLSRGVDMDSICILVDYGDTDYDASACGGLGGGIAVKALSGQKYEIVPDEYRDQVVPNIAAVD